MRQRCLRGEREHQYLNDIVVGCEGGERRQRGGYGCTALSSEPPGARQRNEQIGTATRIMGEPCPRAIVTRPANHGAQATLDHACASHHGIALSPCCRNRCAEPRQYGGGAS